MRASRKQTARSGAWALPCGRKISVKLAAPRSGLGLGAFRLRRRPARPPTGLEPFDARKRRHEGSEGLRPGRVAAPGTSGGVGGVGPPRILPRGSRGFLENDRDGRPLLRLRRQEGGEKAARFRRGRRRRRSAHEENGDHQVSRERKEDRPLHRERFLPFFDDLEHFVSLLRRTTLGPNTLAC